MKFSQQKHILMSLTLLCVGSLSALTQTERMYWNRDGFLLEDPSADGRIRSKVFEGAYMDVQNCTEDHWCYGAVYGHAIGWVPEAYLDHVPTLPPDEEPFLQARRGRKKGPDEYHLVDPRKVFMSVGFDFSAGLSRLETIDNSDRSEYSRAVSVRLARGFHLTNADKWRVDADIFAGFEVMDIRVLNSQGDKIGDFEVSSLLVGASLWRVRPFSPSWGWGWRLRAALKLGQDEHSIFREHPPWYWFSAGPILTHGFGQVGKPEWMEYDIHFKGNHEQFFAVMGVSLIY